MGTVRLSLALLVVYFHAHMSDVVGVPLPNGRLAVQLFYVISGFYMTLILNEKYMTSDMNAVFYSNRFFRLWPPMMVVISLVALQFLITGEVLLFLLEMDLQDFLRWLQDFDPLLLAYLAFTNLFVLGQDWVWFFGVTEDSRFVWCPFLVCSDYTPAAALLLDHPTFTVGIEATFYLISPFVLRRSWRWAVGLCALGLAWHLAVLASGLNPLFWNYHPVTSAAFFYFLGACTYHVYVRLRALPPSGSLRTWLQRAQWPAYAAVVVLAGAAYVTTDALRNILIALMLAAIIPMLFDRTHALRLDRMVGELSYGVYLVHYPLILLMWDLAGQTYGAILALVLVVPAALVLYFSVEAPIDRWRQRRARASGARVTREERPAAAPVKP